MSPLIVTLCLLAVLAGVLLLFQIRPSPPGNLYAVFDTHEEPETFEQEVRRGLACAAELNASPVLLLSANHPTELDEILRLLSREFPISILTPEHFPIP